MGSCTKRRSRLRGLVVLAAEELGGVDQVGKRGLGLLPLAGLETAVRVDPELLGLEVLEHLLNTVLDLLLGGDTRGVDVVDTRADVTGVGLVDEDLEELGVRLAVLDGEDVSVESGDGVEEVLELRVTEVRVDLSGVLDTGGGQLEAVDGPGEVLLALRARAEGKTLTEGGLVNLDDVDASGLKVDDLVTEGEGELLSLDGLVDIVTRERPAETGDGTSEHTLHGLLGDGGGVLALLDGHGLRAGDVTDDDRGTHATGAVRLDPGVGGEDVTVKALTEVLNHVVTLGLTVDVDVKVKLVLDGDNIADLLLNELLVLLGSDLTLGELVTLDADVLGLGEGTNGGGGEHRQGEVSLLLGVTGVEGRLAVVLLSSDGLLPLLDLRVVGAGRGGARVHALGVGLDLLTDGVRALGDGLGDEGNLNDLLAGEGEPVLDLLVELLLAGEGVGSVKEGRRGGDEDTVLAELLDGGLDDLDGLLEVGLPDVTAVNDTGGEHLLLAEVLDDLAELLRVADQVDVKGVGVLEGGVDNVEVVDDVAEVGGESELGTSGALESGELLVGGLESLLDLGGEVEDEDGLINLDGLGASLLELLQELLVDGEELVEERDGVDGLATVGLAEGEERDGTDEDGTGGDAGLLGLLELTDRLGVGGEGEGLVVLESGLDIVVVGVEPLDHLEGGNVNAILLVATAHGEELVDGLEVVLAVTLGDGVEHLDVVEDMVVVGEVVGGDDVDAGVLLDLPVLESQPLALGEEVLARQLAAPVGLVGLLQVTQAAHAREAENCGLHHLCCVCDGKRVMKGEMKGREKGM